MSNPINAAQTWLDTTHGHCVPTAMAAVLDITKRAAAALIHAHDPKALVAAGGVYWSGYSSLMESLGAEIVSGGDAFYPDHKDRWREAHRTYDARLEAWYDGRRRARPQMPTQSILRYTIAGWLKAHPNTTALLRVDGHALAVAGGKVLADTAPSRRSRVQAWIVVARSPQDLAAMREAAQERLDALLFPDGKPEMVEAMSSAPCVAHGVEDSVWTLVLPGHGVFRATQADRGAIMRITRGHPEALRDLILESVEGHPDQEARYRETTAGLDLDALLTLAAGIYRPAPQSPVVPDASRPDQTDDPREDTMTNLTSASAEQLLQVVTTRRMSLVLALKNAVQAKDWNQVAPLAEILEAIDDHLNLWEG